MTDQPDETAARFGPDGHCIGEHDDYPIDGATRCRACGRIVYPYDETAAAPSAACDCPGCTGGEVCEGKNGHLCPGCLDGTHGRDRRHRMLREARRD